MNSIPPVDFRPEKYWDPDQVANKIVRGIEDSDLRQRLTGLWAIGDTKSLELLLHKRSSPDSVELTKCPPWEVEIAKIALDSVNGDIISVRAFKFGQEIGYKVVDEYGSIFMLQREVSEQPLTLGKMIQFLDGTTIKGLPPGGLSMGYNQMNLEAEESTPQALQFFTSITSRFYPGLKRHYDKVFKEWAESGGG